MTEHQSLSQAPASVIPLRMRPDLIAKKLNFGQRSYWNIKDPISMQYFQLREEEYFILRSLDGRATAAEIRGKFERLFAPLRLGATQLQNFLASLASRALVVDDSVGRGAQLLSRHNALRRLTRLQALTNVLAIRWRGINPDRLLGWLYPKCSWLFSRWAMGASVAWLLLAAAWVALQFESFLTRLPSVGGFFSASNLPWIALAIGTSKVLHELGHALTCKHFGGECREIGVMLLVLTPCLYCNVSDAWLIGNKWHRIAISAAGIYVEAVLAAVCLFLWWFSEPGLLNTVCLNVMLVCSVNTILFNGNPLLRYDGYYVLSDLVEVPNLRQRALALLADALAYLCFGTPSNSERMFPTRGRSLLLVYILASTVYRLIVLVSILSFLHMVLTPYGLVVLAQLATVVLSLTYLHALGTFFSSVMERGTRNRNLNTIRASSVLGAAGLLLVLGLLIPLPHAVVAPVLIEPHAAQTVFVPVRGRVPRGAADGPKLKIGDQIRRGDTLIRLENPALELDIHKLQSEITSARSRMDSLGTMRARRQEVGLQLPTLAEAIRDLEEQLAELKKQQAQLVVRAPVAGTILPPGDRRESAPEGELATWTGTPLDAENAGCTLESGTVLCLVGNPRKISGLILVDQSQIGYCRLGQAARCRVNELPGTTLWGKVTSISESQLEKIPESLLEQDVITTIEGTSKPAATYMVRVPLAANEVRVPIGSTGWAKISTAPQSLIQRVLRYLASTFGFV